MFEFLFGIDEQLRREGRRDRFQLVFFNPATEPGNRLGSKAMQHLLSQMRARGITTYLGHKMQRFAANKVVTEGSEFAADLILFMPGMTGNALAGPDRSTAFCPADWSADAQCRVPGRSRVYVVGDCGSFPARTGCPSRHTRPTSRP